MNRIILSSMALSLAVASFAVYADEGKTVQIDVEAYKFAPKTVTVAKGTTVVWVNHDETPHNIIASGQQFKSPALDTNESFRWTFKDAGTYTYFCRLHPFMTGSVTVTP